MPLIQIQSLPITESFAADKAVLEIAESISAATDIPTDQIMVTWTIIESGHYANDKTAAVSQPVESHPVLVEVTAPDFNPDDAIEALLGLIAAYVAEQAGVSVNNVFALFRGAGSGRVFSGGEIEAW